VSIEAPAFTETKERKLAVVRRPIVTTSIDREPAISPIPRLLNFKRVNSSSEEDLKLMP